MKNNMRSKIWNLIRGGSFHGYLRTVSGYPLTLTDCMAEYPVSLAVAGNTVQNGTPAPDNPVEVQGCGDKAEEGYKVLVIVSGNTGAESQTFPIYTDAPLYGNGDISDTVELDVKNRTATRIDRISVDDSGNITQLAAPVTTDISDMQDWDSIPKLWRGTAILTADTTVSPSALVCDYYSKNRVWGVRFPTAALSSSPTGTRTCLAKGMVAMPSTDTVKNRNDFDNVPAFKYDYVNGYLDKNNVFIETAVKGKDDTFAFDGSNGDVYSRFKLSYWRRLTGDGYVEYQITHEYIPNDGWCPFGIFVNPDGTLNDYAYIASYEMGYNSEGLCASVSGIPVAHNTYDNRNATTAGLSHNTQLTEFRKKGSQYCGMTSKEVMFLQYLFMIEFATLNSQSIMYGAASYNYQYNVAVAETGVERIVITNAQAANIIVGSTVSVGTPYVTNSGTGATSNDRGYSTLNSIVNRRLVTRKEALSDGVNTAIYIDNGGNTFNTTTGTIISTMPWYTGITDSVLGSSGSPVSNTNGKYPMKYRGVENLYGNMWTIISDVIISSYVPYVCYDCTKFSTGVTSDYTSLNYSIATTSGSYAKELGYDSTHSSVQIPISVGGSSSTYLCDYYYVESGVREVLFGGCVFHEAYAGLFYFSCSVSPSVAGWSIAARLSVNGRHGAAVT